jgi:S1-C subfamily serine protease
LLATSLLAACAGSQRDAHGPHAGAGALCNVTSPLTETAASLRSSHEFGASSPLYFLVRLDERIGSLRVARRALGASMAKESRALSDKLEELEGLLVARRAKVASAIEHLASTREAAASALTASAKCKGLDLRAQDVEVASESLSKAARTTLASAACEPSRRLWSAAASVNLENDTSAASIASHVTELTLDAERGAVRDALAKALRAQSEAVAALHAVTEPGIHEAQSADDLLALDVEHDIDALERTCAEDPRPTDRIVGASPAPRRVTVTVRPKWTGALAALPHAEEFGSGFVVRWRGDSGAIEARVVTNNHVMDGAFEAEIVSSDPDASLDKSGHPPTWTAKLVRASPHDDVAILRLDDASQKVFREGISLRLSPAREDEQVIAAGFPGVGIAPSFQVSRGTVSNAHFGAEGADALAAAYVQHTAPIDPGNSGGPLLDAKGLLLGMNTLKIVGRENVGLAIPTARIQDALLRAEERADVDDKQAEASCNAIVAALSSTHPTEEAMSRFGLALFESLESEAPSPRAATFRERVEGEARNPADLARRMAYAEVRARVEKEQGVVGLAPCRDVKRTPTGFIAAFRTRKGEHFLRFAEEHGVVRAIAID